jgi:hypothetical protein
MNTKDESPVLSQVSKMINRGEAAVSLLVKAYSEHRAPTQEEMQKFFTEHGQQNDKPAATGDAVVARGPIWGNL